MQRGKTGNRVGRREARIESCSPPAPTGTETCQVDTNSVSAVHDAELVTGVGPGHSPGVDRGGQYRASRSHRSRTRRRGLYRHFQGVEPDFVAARNVAGRRVGGRFVIADVEPSWVTCGCQMAVLGDMASTSEQA